MILATQLRRLAAECLDKDVDFHLADENLNQDRVSLGWELAASAGILDPALGPGLAHHPVELQALYLLFLSAAVRAGDLTMEDLP